VSREKNIIDYWLINQTIKAIQYELIDVLSLPKKNIFRMQEKEAKRIPVREEHYCIALQQCI
jgi:hypothetical protein